MVTLQKQHCEWSAKKKSQFDMMKARKESLMRKRAEKTGAQVITTDGKMPPFFIFLYRRRG